MRLGVFFNNSTFTREELHCDAIEINEAHCKYCSEQVQCYLSVDRCSIHHKINLEAVPRHHSLNETINRTPARALSSSGLNSLLQPTSRSVPITSGGLDSFYQDVVMIHYFG